MLFVVFSIV